MQSIHIKRLILPILILAQYALADASIAEVADGSVDPSGTILNIGNVAAGDAVVPTLNLRVRKMGARSCLTSGRVTALDATIRVRFPQGVCNLPFSGTATFVHQI